MYRLAVIEADNAHLAMVEVGQRLLSLDEATDGAASSRLGGAPADLLPLLRDWSTWDVILTQATSTSAAHFQSAGKRAEDVRFCAPIAEPGKIVCIGSNFYDHIEEMGIPVVPTYPYSFLKPANNTVRGSGDPVAMPAKSKMMDWEAELGVVIGWECAHVPKANALEHVAGYLNFNDLSCRDWLATRPAVGIDWVQHKAFDGFAPMGPYLVPAEFVPDPQNLAMRLTLNDEIRQNSTTAKMVFGVADIIEHLSSIMTLYPGDIIATGTPAGVGHGAVPPRYLQAGDEVVIEIGELGRLVTPIVSQST